MSEPIGGTEDKGPGEKFGDEILSACLRWWEESDLTAEEIYVFGEASVRAFAEAQGAIIEEEEVIFEADFDLDEEEAEE